MNRFATLVEHWVEHFQNISPPEAAIEVLKRSLKGGRCVSWRVVWISPSFVRLLARKLDLFFPFKGNFTVPVFSDWNFQMNFYWPLKGRCWLAVKNQNAFRRHFHFKFKVMALITFFNVISNFLKLFLNNFVGLVKLIRERSISPYTPGLCGRTFSLIEMEQKDFW